MGVYGGFSRNRPIVVLLEFLKFEILFKGDSSK